RRAPSDDKHSPVFGTAAALVHYCAGTNAARCYLFHYSRHMLRKSGVFAHQFLGTHFSLQDGNRKPDYVPRTVVSLCVFHHPAYLLHQARTGRLASRGHFPTMVSVAGSTVLRPMESG